MHEFKTGRCISEALREDRRLLEFLLDEVPVGISVLRGTDHRIEMANQTAQTMFGREQLIGRPIAEVLPALAGGRSMADLVYQTGEPVRVIESEVNPLHQRHCSYWNIDLIPLLEADGSIGGLLAMAIDVTEEVLLRRRAEGLNTELKRTNAHLQGILQQLPVGVLISDETGRVILANEQARGLCRPPDLDRSGQEPDSYPLCPMDGLCSPIELTLKRSLATGNSLVNEEVSLIYPDRTSRTFLCNTAPLRDLTGETLGAVGVYRDITAVKEAERAREASLNNLQRLLRVTTEIQAESTLESLARRIAEAARELTGADGAFAACGRAENAFRFSAASWEAGHPPPDELGLLSAAPPDRLLDLLADGGINSFGGDELTDAKLYCSSTAPCRPLMGALLSGRDQEPAGLIAICGRPGGGFSQADETVLAQLAAVASLRVQNLEVLRELERQIQAQLDFLRVISHELRQPLTVIMAQAQLLARVKDHPDRAGRCAQAISTSAWRMNAMIQDLVDSARMESGQLRLKLRPADLALIAQDLLERIKVSLDASRIRLHAPEGLPRIAIDADRFERILTNLLTNALKYSASETWIDLRFESTGAEVLIKVADQGRGISPEDLPHIFERYYRSREVRDLEEGLGLGLYITKGLVEAHGGRIWAESALGVGTTFYLAFPVGTE